MKLRYTSINWLLGDIPLIKSPAVGSVGLIGLQNRNSLASKPIGLGHPCNAVSKTVSALDMVTKVGGTLFNSKNTC